jgi:hypothetical protein
MLRNAPFLFVLSLFGYLAYKEWATYPDLVPDERALRQISRIARRHHISYEAAYIRWANQRLKWTRYGYLVGQA